MSNTDVWGEGWHSACIMHHFIVAEREDLYLWQAPQCEMSRVPGSGQEDQEGQDVLPAVHESLHSLASLKHRHVETLTRLGQARSQSHCNSDTEGLLMRLRINETKDSLQRLELGLEEGGLVIALSEYEQQFEQDQVQREIELLKIKNENDWLREELEETERRLEDVLSTIAALEIGKKHHHFIQEVKN